MDPTSYETSVQNEVSNYMQTHELGAIVKDTLASDLMVEKSGSEVILRSY